MMEEFPTFDDLVASVLNINTSFKTVPAELGNIHGFGSAQHCFDIVTDVKKTRIFVKKCESDGELERRLHVLDKENLMYTGIIPGLFNFLEEQNPSFAAELKPLFVHLYGVGKVGTEVHFVFEDFNTSRPDNYAVTKATVLHDLQKIKIVLKRLGQFHGAMFGWKNTRKIDFPGRYPLLQIDGLVEPSNKDFLYPHFERNFSVALNMLYNVSVAHSNGACQRLQRVCNPDFIRDVLNCVPDLQTLMRRTAAVKDDKFAIPTHGDFHQHNIALSGTDAIFFDFQLPRYSSPLIDVHQYLSQAMYVEDTKSHLSEVQALYYLELTNTCKIHGFESGPFADYDEFIANYYDTSPWAFIFGTAFTVWKHVENFDVLKKYSDVLDTCYKKGDDSEDIADKSISALDEMGSRMWEAVQMLVDFVNMCEQDNILKVIKERLAE